MKRAVSLTIWSMSLAIADLARATSASVIGLDLMSSSAFSMASSTAAVWPSFGTTAANRR
ncbi:hypothetical protein D3C84_1315250 [compost metagenome]